MQSLNVQARSGAAQRAQTVAGRRVGRVARPVIVAFKADAASSGSKSAFTNTSEGVVR